MSKSAAYVYLQSIVTIANHAARITTITCDSVGWVSGAVADAAIPAVVLLLVDFDSHLK